MILMLLLAAIAGLVFVVLCAHGTQRYLRRNDRRSPVTRELLRGPGHSLSKTIDDLSFDAAMYLSIAPVILVTLTAIYLQIDTGRESNQTLVTATYVLVAVGTLSFCAWKIVDTISRLHRLRIGLESERAAAEELNLLMAQQYRVFHDVPGDGPFNVDHVIVGPTGVFAIETKGRLKPSTKTAKSAHRVQSDGRTLQFPGWREIRPIAQAERNARWLGQWLSSAIGEPVRAKPLVLLPGWLVDRKHGDGVWVLNPKEVAKYLAAQDRATLDEKHIRRIAHQLDARCRDIAPVVSPKREKAT